MPSAPDAPLPRDTAARVVAAARREPAAAVAVPRHGVAVAGADLHLSRPGRVRRRAVDLENNSGLGVVPRSCDGLLTAVSVSLRLHGLPPARQHELGEEGEGDRNRSREDGPPDVNARALAALNAKTEVPHGEGRGDDGYEHRIGEESQPLLLRGIAASHTWTPLVDALTQGDSRTGGGTTRNHPRRACRW